MRNMHFPSVVNECNSESFVDHFVILGEIKEIETDAGWIQNPIVFFV